MPKQQLPMHQRLSNGPDLLKPSVTDVTGVVAEAMDWHGVPRIQVVMDNVMLEEIAQSMTASVNPDLWHLEQMSGDAGAVWRGKIAPYLADLAVGEQHIRKACAESELLYESDQQGAILFEPLVVANRWLMEPDFWKEVDGSPHVMEQKWAVSNKADGIQADF